MEERSFLVNDLLLRDLGVLDMSSICSYTAALPRDHEIRSVQYINEGSFTDLSSCEKARI